MLPFSFWLLCPSTENYMTFLRFICVKSNKVSVLEQTVLGKWGTVPAHRLGRSPLSAALEVRVAHGQQKEQDKRVIQTPFHHPALGGFSALTKFLPCICTSHIYDVWDSKTLIVKGPHKSMGFVSVMSMLLLLIPAPLFSFTNALQLPPCSLKVSRIF